MKPPQSPLASDVDPDGLLEYSVVYTDRTLNHMSARFQGVMNDLSTTLKSVYNAHAVAIVPGGGSFAMEAVARQFTEGLGCLVVHNGWFSYRWSQIIEAGKLSAGSIVLKAAPLDPSNPQSPFAPPPIAEVVDTISRDKPGVVFAPHVETSAGMILSNDYLRAISDATHAIGGLFVLDCIASGTMWIDMESCGVDVLISAPQKGWSGPACAGMVMLSAAAFHRMQETQSSSFVCDLKKWHQIMKAYEDGGHAYHATMPTDALAKVRDVMQETQAFGLGEARSAQIDLGNRVRDLLEAKGFASVAAPGFQSPSVVVSHTDDQEIHKGIAFKQHGIQIAAGVPLACDEPEGFQTFRIGLFGLDKLQDVDGCVKRFSDALDRICK